MSNRPRPTWPRWWPCSVRSAACCAMTAAFSLIWATLTLPVINVPPGLLRPRVLLHVTAVTQDLQIGPGLVMLIPIFVMDAEPRGRRAALAAPNRRHNLGRLGRREAVITRARVPLQHHQALRFSTFRRPPSLYLVRHLG